MGAKPIEVDGSFGEGGGQILRTSLSLACITGSPVRICNIRAGRAKPGLKPQHLLSAHAAAAISNGGLSGAVPDSSELAFRPGPVKPGDYTFDVASIRSSAGATGLVFQTVAPALFFAKGPSELKIKGGTHVEWSPPADYIKDVFLPAVAPMGISAEFKNPVKGYYPLGGGVIESSINPSAAPLRPLDVTERGRLIKVSILSMVSNLPLSTARRQLESAGTLLKARSIEYQGNCVEAPSPGKGTFLFILADCGPIRAGFSALGARGKKAEEVGQEAAEKFLCFMDRKGALDPHLADQLVLFMALADGTSSITTTEVTNHLKTNIHVIEKFLPVRFDLRGGVGEEGSIRVKGCGFR